MIPGLATLAPGLYVAALGGLLGLALGWLGERVPWRVWTTVALLLALFLGPALFAGRTLLPLDNLRGQAPFLARAPSEPHGNALQGDLLTLVAPLQRQTRDAWAAGRWPLWNHAAGAGMPLLANLQAQALAPLAVLALPFSLERGAAVAAALRLLVGLVFAFLFFRRLGLREVAALFGSVSYALGGFLGLWLGWPIANAAALLPAGLYAVVAACDGGRRRDVALWIVVVWAILNGGQPESILYALGVVALFALARLRRLPSGPRLGALRRLAAGAAVALALAAPAIGPALEWLPQTQRFEDRGAPPVVEETRQWSSLALLRWLPIVAPNVFGNGRYGDPSGAVYWGESNINEDAAGFAGTLAVAAALAGLAARRRIAHQGFAAALLAASLTLVAPPAPLARWLGELPFWRLSASGHHRLLLVVALALAWLGACGVERAARGELRWGRLLAVALGLAALLVWGTLAHAHPEHPQALAVLRLGWLKLQLEVLAAGALLLWAASRRRAASGLLVALAAGELLILQVAQHPLVESPAFPPSSPALEWVAARAGAQRVAALDRALPANLAGLWGLRDARIYDPAAPRSYGALVRPLGWPGEFHAGEHRLYDSLAVRYLLTEPERAVPGGARLVYAEADAWVWERPGAAAPVTLLPPDPDDSARLAWREIGPQRWQLAAALEAPRLVAVSLYGDPGWRLLRNGARLGSRGPLIAAALPAGRSRLELLYRPAIFIRGLGLAAVAAAAALAWLLPPPPRRTAPTARPPRIDAGFRRKMAR